MITLVQSAKGKTTAIGGASSVSATWPSATTSGNFLILGLTVSGGSNETVTTPSGWTKVGEIDNSTNVKTALYYIANAAPRSGAESISYSPAAYGIIGIGEWSGVDTASVLDVFATNTGNSSSPDSGTTATTAQADELLVAFIGAFGAGTFSAQTSPTNSFTLEQDEQTGTGVTLDGALLDRIVSATGTYNTSTTIGSANTWAGIIATFKAAPPTPTYTVTPPSPSSGFIGEVSQDFTVEGFDLAGDVEVTPSSGTPEVGVFDPAFVTLTIGSPVQTFTFLPVVTGVIPISTTNDSALSDPADNNYTVSGFPDYALSYAFGYGVDATNNADWMRDPSNTTGVAIAVAGEASVSFTIDYGVDVTISQFAGTVGYAWSLTDQWEYSSDGVTWNSLSVTPTYTPAAASGTYTNFYQIWTPSSPITAQYFRYSIKDTAAGSDIAQAGITLIYGSPGDTPVAGASGSIGGLASSGTLYAGCWSPIDVMYDHTDTFPASIVPTPAANASSPDAFKITIIGPTAKIEGGTLSILQSIIGANNTDGPTDGTWYSNDNSDVFPNGPAIGVDGRYYYRQRWDAYWWGQSKVRLGFFFCAFADYFFQSGVGVLSEYTTLADGRSFPLTEIVTTYYYTKKKGVFLPGPPPIQTYYYERSSTIDYYIGRYTILNYTLPQIGSGQTETIATVQFLNATSPFDEAGITTDQFAWILLCNYYGEPAGGRSIGQWFVEVDKSTVDNDTHTSWQQSPYFYDVGGPSETTLDVTVPDFVGETVPPGDPVGVGLAYALVPGDDIFETFGGGIYAMSATFVIIRDTDAGPPDTGGPNDSVRQVADTFNNHIAFAWVSGTSSSGGLKHALIRDAVLGGGLTRAWESIEEIESANASDLGLTYLPNGRLYLCYDLSGSKKYRTNDSFGTMGEWSASGTPDPNVSRHSSCGRGQAQAFRFRALTHSSAGDIEFSQCRDATGIHWTAPNAAIVGTALGPWCGGVWLGNQYGVLYTNQSDGKIYWNLASDPDGWDGAGTDTTLTGRIIGATKVVSGVIIGAVWDATSKKTRCLRSRDLGATWEMDGADIDLIPELDTPPCIVSLHNVAFLIWQQNDTPLYVSSSDGGETWVG